MLSMPDITRSPMTASRSTSSSVAADFPPSSRVQRLICSPQMPPTIPPVSTDPVKLTLSIFG
ncbi:MAG: hypothetical protein R2695_07695 [Acidimicrobiales bacterium]